MFYSAILCGISTNRGINVISVIYARGWIQMHTHAEMHGYFLAFLICSDLFWFVFGDNLQKSLNLATSRNKWRLAQESMITVHGYPPCDIYKILMYIMAFKVSSTEEIAMMSMICMPAQFPANRSTEVLNARNTINTCWCYPLNRSVIDCFAPWCAALCF